MTQSTLNVAKNLYARYEQVEPVQNYYGLVAVYALCRAALQSNDEALLQKCKAILAQYPDGMQHPRYNFENYRAGGNGQAFLLFKNKTETDALVREYAEKTLAAPKSADGLMCMPHHPEKGQVWIDIVTCATPFMLFAGLHFAQEKYIRFAIDQCFGMYDLFMDPACGLLHQSIGFMPDPTAISHDHWSRGNGWGIVGLTELVQYLPGDHPDYEQAKRRFVMHLRALLPYQTRRGLWRQEICEPLSWEESSGTGLILYAMGTGLQLGLLSRQEFDVPFKKGIQGLADWCVSENFDTRLSCPGCLCPGEGDTKGTVQAYLTDKLPSNNEHHSFGCIMLAFLAADAAGVKEVDWNKPHCPWVN